MAAAFEISLCQQVFDYATWFDSALGSMLFVLLQAG